MLPDVTAIFSFARFFQGWDFFLRTFRRNFVLVDVDERRHRLQRPVPRRVESRQQLKIILIFVKKWNKSTTT